ncbi:MAG TPA: amidohydrolase family protein [Xanthobacteraceae bacterium]|jgi:aminocarboxymuconate-semialdehyde decarboxylase|nr:amidohydrolase family protein [Xanthobacteraceae bacterium]
MIIDAHAHFVPQALLDDALAQKSFPSVKVASENGAVRFAFAGQDSKRPVPAGMSDVERRRKWLADRGIDKQVVGGWLDMFGYDLPADEGLEWNRFLNSHLLKATAKIPFLVPLATVPMQSGKHAAQALEEALNQGFHGAMIGTQPKGASGVLDDPDLNPFWEVASARKATLFIHPTFGARDDRLKAYGLVSAVGRVTDTTMAMARLLYSGHLVRYPDVNLVISHGGAALPMILGRLRRSFATAPAQNADPVPGFHKLYFDSVVYDPMIVRFICEIASPGRVVMGTDEPFAIAEQQPVKLIEECNFNASDKQAILGGTAAKLFGIS